MPDAPTGINPVEVWPADWTRGNPASEAAASEPAASLSGTVVLRC
ncbi:hypothetical protein [Actinacidiphila oryziradicis]|nr:hypothetical protein [Actinacidiphila oryziradicis]